MKDDMKSAMKMWLISKDQTLKIFPIRTDYFVKDWIEYQVYYSTDEILKENLKGEDLDIYLEDDDIAHCLGSEFVFESIDDLFYYFEQNYK